MDTTARDDDDLACPHDADYIGRISWPTELRADTRKHAAGSVCHRPTCQGRSADAVARRTGHRGVFEPFHPRQSTRIA